MDKSLLVIIITLACGIGFCVPAARRSVKRDAIYGGTLAEIFHYIGVAAYIAVPPSAILGSFLVGPLKLGIPLAFSYLGIAMVALLFYALIEHSARANRVVEDHGWTEQDARSSGL